jgi:hypothetical protein
MIILRTFIGSAHEGRVRVGQISWCGARARGGHGKACLLGLIDAISASQRIRIAPSLLEAAAENLLIPHYRIAGQIRFDPRDLDEWVKCHRIDEIGKGRRASRDSCSGIM